MHLHIAERFHEPKSSNYGLFEATLFARIFITSVDMPMLQVEF